MSLFYPPHSWERNEKREGKQYREGMKSLDVDDPSSATNSQYDVE